MCKLIFLMIFRISSLLFCSGLGFDFVGMVLKFCFFWFVLCGDFKLLVNVLLGKEFD